MIVLNEKLNVIVASRAFFETFRTSPEDTHGKPFYELAHGQWNISSLRTLLEQVIPEQKIIENYELEHEFENLGHRIMMINAREIKYENGQRKMLLFIQDVTARRAADKHRERLMQQKDTLLKEMRHRIANSLQLIASIILLKAGSVQSEESRLHLEDAHDRIISIATVQRNLDPTGDDSEVPVVQYLRTLCQSLATSMIGGRKPITLTVTGGKSTVTPDEAIGLGLITTELVINALKHAFPGGEGEVVIDYEGDAQNWKLTVRDNGVGLPPIDKTRKDGLGTSIIESLTNQLNAEVSRTSSDRGTAVTISRPVGGGSSSIAKTV